MRPLLVSVGFVAEPEMKAMPARPNSGPTAWTSWLPAGPTTPTIFEFEVNCCVTVVAIDGVSCVSPCTSVMFVPLALLSSATASLAKASCSPPSDAAGPVIGPWKPTDTVHLPPLEPLLADFVDVLLLLLLLLPQPAAISALSAIATSAMRPFNAVPPPGG